MRRLKRHGLNSSCSRIKIKGLSRGRHQVMEGKIFFRLSDKVSCWISPCETMKPFSVIIYPFNIFLYLASSINIGAASLVNHCTYTPLFG